MSSDLHIEISSRNLVRINGFGYRESIAVMEAHRHEPQATPSLDIKGSGRLPEVVLTDGQEKSRIRSFVASAQSKPSGSSAVRLGGQRHILPLL